MGFEGFDITIEQASKAIEDFKETLRSFGSEVSKGEEVICSTYVPDKGWVKTVSSLRPEPIQELHNCNNCGGTVDEEGYCRYCGSRVYFFGERKPKFHNKFDVGF